MKLSKLPSYNLILYSAFMFCSCNFNGQSEKNDPKNATDSVAKFESSDKKLIGNSIIQQVDSITGETLFIEYFHSGKIKHKWMEVPVNGGICISNEQFFDSTGFMVKEKNYKYDAGVNYHDTHVITEIIDYFSNGKIKSRKFLENYLMGEECDCGVWEYFDENGKLSNKENKESCEDGKLGCVE
ncbi:MAG TPA: hypothetical protein VK177_16875 [Flavobacteriales bacterium]|nr:hypothetical protein [Flavobacteriales bacterium]